MDATAACFHFVTRPIGYTFLSASFSTFTSLAFSLSLSLKIIHHLPLLVLHFSSSFPSAYSSSSFFLSGNNSTGQIIFPQTFSSILQSISAQLPLSPSPLLQQRYRRTLFPQTGR